MADVVKMCDVIDTCCSDIDGCYLDSGDDIGEDMAWMPLPEPYKEEYDEN